MDRLTLGFNEAHTYRCSPNVTPEIAHSVKCCIQTSLDKTGDLAVFYTTETIEDYRRAFKQKHAPDVIDDVWVHYDTSAALFDEWIDHDYLHIVLYDFSQDRFLMLQEIADIHQLGSVEWSRILREVLRSERWNGKRMKIYIAEADLVFL